MIASPIQALDRTFLLMRDDVREEVTDEQLLEALTGTRVILCADALNADSHAGQCAFVTAALLMARSAHQVHLIAPDVPLRGVQPPLKPGGLITSLLEVGRDLLPGVEFCTALPNQADLMVVLGNSPARGRASHFIGIDATAWSATLVRRPAGQPWGEPEWPFGSMAAGALAAGEAFKQAMLKLAPHARAPAYFQEFFAPTRDVRVELAPPAAPRGAQLGRFDCISAGAITNAVLYCLSRIPEVSGSARLIEDATSDPTNLNRYSLLRASEVGSDKSRQLAGVPCSQLRLTAAPFRYDAVHAERVEPLAPRVLVGVDHIPTRWFVQNARPDWLVIGATSHWNAMSSFHTEGLACARCAHPRDDEAGDGPIPTVAMVSFWAGLWVAALFARHAAGETLIRGEQLTYMTPLGRKPLWRGPISAGCPECRIAGRVRVA